MESVQTRKAYAELHGKRADTESVVRPPNVLGVSCCGRSRAPKPMRRDPLPPMTFAEPNGELQPP